MEGNRKLNFIPKRNNSMVIKVFHEYSDLITDILKDSTFNEYQELLQDLEIDLPFGTEIWEFLNKHERTFKILTARYLEIDELAGNTSKILLRNNQYVKYINRLRKKKIGMVKDKRVLDPSDKMFWYWDRQNLFKEIIEENILKHYKNYYYTTVDDVLNFFAGEIESKSTKGKELYNNFLNENGNFDFSLTCEGIGRYIKIIERFFKKKRIHYQGNRLNIYCLVDNDPLL